MDVAGQLPGSTEGIHLRREHEPLGREESHLRVVCDGATASIGRLEPSDPVRSEALLDLA